MTQYVGKSGQCTLLWLEQKTQPHSALRIAAWLLSDTISCLLIETINENLIVTLTRILIDWPTDEVHWLDYKTSPSDRLPDHGLADLAQCLNSVEREVWASQTTAPVSVSCSSYGLREEEASWWVGWKTQRRSWCNRRKKKESKAIKERKQEERKSIIWTKHAIHLGHLPLCACARVYVCVCKGLYKGGWTAYANV